MLLINKAGTEPAQNLKIMSISEIGEARQNRWLDEESQRMAGSVCPECRETDCPYKGICKGVGSQQHEDVAEYFSEYVRVVSPWISSLPLTPAI